MATAIITGSARGIGAAIALRLAKDGYNIALNDISDAMFEDNSIMDDIKALGVECAKYVADVSDHQQCADMVKAVKERFGSIDVLVNNAGIIRDGLLARMSEENFDLVIAVNQKSVFNMTKFAGSVMMKQRSGRIINLSSVAGLYGNAGQMNYSASKAAIIGMTKTTAKELGSRGITCNAVAPGFISTPMTDKLSDEVKNSILSMIAMKRYGEVNEIAGVVSFLASPDASYVTGQVIEISGGLSM
ncbi:MAG: 3-oxoacyl-[acyl-carrier-protein] reductase [Ruminococcaceae bacterium]|nr:3-oxoacyl-[acyl-carrier-protein] reductase [Oscillospiraceae bacterium]